MNTKEKENLFQELTKFSIVKGQSVTSERITLTIELLKKFNYEEIIKALNLLIYETPFFPDISEIVKKIKEFKTNEEDHTINNILEKINIYGFANYDACEFNTLERSLIASCGGWGMLCEANGYQLNQALKTMKEALKNADKLEVINHERLN